MMRALIIAALIMGTAVSAGAERLWLVIGASDSSAERIAQKAKLLAPGAPRSLIVQTSDCGDKKNMFAWVAEIAITAEDAQAALSRLRKTVKDAYVKRCDVIPGTLLALRVTAVDPSIADVPGEAVNWQDEDRVSSVYPLPDGRFIIIARYFTGEVDDPLEGRRERVILVESQERRVVLENNCPSPGPVVSQHGRVAFHCAREQAGDHLLHNTLVFDSAGKKIMEVERCRNPRWQSESVIVCDEESVGPDGQLKLRAKRVILASPTQSGGVCPWKTDGSIRL